MGQWLSMVALGVFAFRAGGASAVGALGAARYLLGAIAAPPLALLADRLPRVRVMVASDLARSCALLGMTVDTWLNLSAWPVYVLACLVTMAAAAFYPAQTAALPALARTPEELTAASVASGSIGILTGLLGAALGGVLFAAAGTAVVFMATALCFVLSACLLGGVHVPPPLPAAAADGYARVAGHRGAGLVHETLAGAALILRDSRLRTIVGLYAASALVWSIVSVLVVVLALDDLALGASGVGYLTGATFVGALVGALAAAIIAGGERLGTTGLGLGALLWGAPIAVIGLSLDTPVTFIAFAVTGIGQSLIEVASMTLLQRSVRDHLMARVFGALQSVTVGALALGAALAPILVSGIGVRRALIATGTLMPLLTVLAWRRLVAIDALVALPAPARIRLLRSIAIFRALPEAQIEALAGRLRSLPAASGEVVVRQGEPGEFFYVLESGQMEVAVDGLPDGTLLPGDFFGEIALLREVPRTATVIAMAESRLLTLERDPFIAAVTGHAPSSAAADAVIDSRLLRPRL
jgi:MFS family permease